MYEHFFQCLPIARDWEEISMLIDSSIARQIYVEDCEVCCNPIEVIVQCNDNQIIAFKAQDLEQ